MGITAAVGGALGGAVISAHGAKKAANTQADASKYAADQQMAMYQQTREDQTPWRQAGGQAVGALSNWYGLGGQTPDYQSMLQNMPGYQFQMQQGNEAVQRNLAARGLLQSGAAGKALQQYGQGVASSYADKYVNGLQSLAGLGQTSVAQTGAAGTSAAANAGNAIQNGATGVASGQVGQANAWANGLQGLVGLGASYFGNQQSGYQVPQDIQGIQQHNFGLNYGFNLGNP
jgi:hypothetical protein